MFWVTGKILGRRGQGKGKVSVFRPEPGGGDTGREEEEWSVYPGLWEAGTSNVNSETRQSTGEYEDRE